MGNLQRRAAATTTTDESKPANAAPHTAPDQADTASDTVPGAAADTSTATTADGSTRHNPGFDQPQLTVQPTTAAGSAAAVGGGKRDGAAATGMVVVRQLAPEVTQLVSRGNGTHRMTLTLQPEQLGEVRVTLVVRDGSVHVRLAADQAKEALVQGAPELRRLLEATGAVARVVVRDLGGTPTAGFSVQQPGQPGQSGQPGHEAGQQGLAQGHPNHPGSHPGSQAAPQGEHRSSADGTPDRSDAHRNHRDQRADRNRRDDVPAVAAPTPGRLDRTM